MSALKFYPLKVQEIRQETDDCISVLFDVPKELESTFRFVPGQYLTIRLVTPEWDIRRSYSICSGLNDGELRVAVKKVEQGKFTGYAHHVLKVGDVLEVMPPMGTFCIKQPTKKHKNYLAFAAGSGITPIMSIMKTVLENEPESTFSLVFGNRNRGSVIFREEIEGLKNSFMGRLRLYHVLSRELMDVQIFNGRITSEKCSELFDGLIDPKEADEAFICGPEEMLHAVKKSLTEHGMASEKIHIELFTSPEQPLAADAGKAAAGKADNGTMSRVSVTVDGITIEMEVPYDGESILEAALNRGADLPFACKGGVCCTCRARIMEGEVEMTVNYALEPDEVAKGFVLTCQSHPRTARVVVDFDQR